MSKSQTAPAPLDIPALTAEISSTIRALTNRDTASVRAMRRELSKRIANAAPRDVVELALRVMDGPTFEYRFVAYELVAHHKGALASLGVRDLEGLGRGLDSWWSVDTFGCYLSGPAWRERQVPDRVIHAWVKSEDRWWRRAALVSTVGLNNRARGGRGDAERTLDICRRLVDDRDDMVVKAMSWALRELAKHAPEAVRAFMKEQEGKLAARVVREVNNKLTTGLKNPSK